MARPSAFVGRQVKTLIAGCFTVWDKTLTQYRQMARGTEQLKIEPSAAAGFAGPRMVSESGFRAAPKLAPENVLHLLWITGGRYLPE